MMSGTTPKYSDPVRVPIRPNAVCASSKISSIPRSSAACRSACMNARGGTSTPPALITGSTMIAAPRPADCMSNIRSAISSPARADSSSLMPGKAGR